MMGQQTWFQEIRYTVNPIVMVMGKMIMRLMNYCGDYYQIMGYNVNHNHKPTDCGDSWGIRGLTRGNYSNMTPPHVVASIRISSEGPKQCLKNKNDYDSNLGK
jgi:hypothetical protein